MNFALSVTMRRPQPLDCRGAVRLMPKLALLMLAFGIP